MKNEEIEFIPYGKQTITDSDIEAVRQVLKAHTSHKVQQWRYLSKR